MTQPTSINMTFDTSLVDLQANTSFSTTESDPSDAGTSKTYGHNVNPSDSQQGSSDRGAGYKAPNPLYTVGTLDEGSRQPHISTPVQHVTTKEAYNQWASVYDSDGNMLQSIDDNELLTMIPSFLSQVLSHVPSESSSIHVVDLGCGTGRNTTKLITYGWPTAHRINITALDFSSGMLDVATKKIQSLPLNTDKYANPTTRLEQCDCFPTVSEPSASPLPSIPGSALQPAHAVLSTLVLEHVPLPDFFSTLASLLVEGGYALVSNMHSDMGQVSQAGFINEVGVKVRGQSFAHTTEETREHAQRAGFEVLDIRERRVEKKDLEKGIVGVRGGKWIGVLVWYGLMLKKIA